MQVPELSTDLRAEYGFACLFISHDLAVINSIADRVVVLKAGSVVESGPVTDVFGNPGEDYTRRLPAAVPASDPVHARRVESTPEHPRLALGA
ncbi:hypothetical protein OHB26_18490 [Nocardia sp. NBC_01503]|uniref:hypothetical protein n=1 Tax=Nocardia sp. NBC_01503 TaxID=2975997 RepID=UPI002E7BEE87|nr:hypothetical protein [Nocardia sp. NBC_01503]WTL36007.1 hypothetical protein OHB26_18490 [Nocardia sp. NBC_01503]